MKILIIVFIPLLFSCSYSQSNSDAEFNAIKSADARIELGFAYLENEEIQKAHQNFDIAAQYAPDYYRPLASIAYYYEIVGNTPQAESHYLKAIQKAPKNGELLHNYATYLCKQKKYVSADDYFIQAIKQPNYYLIANSYENAAYCALENQQKEKAIGYFQQALAYEPKKIQARLQLSELLINNKDYLNARKHLTILDENYGEGAHILKRLNELEELEELNKENV